MFKALTITGREENSWRVNDRIAGFVEGEKRRPLRSLPVEGIEPDTEAV